MKIVVTVDEFGGFSRNNRIPWNLKEERIHFNTLTLGSVCVMGRRTHEFFQRRYIEDRSEIGRYILPNRECYVLSNTNIFYKGALWVPSLEIVKSLHPDKQIFLVGGLQTLKEFIDICTDIHMTVIKKSYNCDKVFPSIDLKKFHVKSEHIFKSKDGIDVEVLHFSK